MSSIISNRKKNDRRHKASQLAFYVNLYRAVIGPSATLTGRWRPDIDLRRMLTGLVPTNSHTAWLWMRKMNKEIKAMSSYTRGNESSTIVKSPAIADCVRGHCGQYLQRQTEQTLIRRSVQRRLIGSGIAVFALATLWDIGYSRVNPYHDEEIKMPRPLPIFSQLDYLIQVVDTNSHNGK